MNRIKLLLTLLLFAGIMPLAVVAQPAKKAKATKSSLKQVKQLLFYEDFALAIPQLEQLLQDDPENAYYNFWMGKCLYITYKKNSALKYFDKTAKLNPEVDKDFHWYYALTLHYNLKFDQAIEEYNLGLQRYEPGSADYAEIQNRISQCQFAKKLRIRKEGNLVKITNLGPSINTEFAEHSPVISANDSLLIFTARRPECLGADPETHYYDEDIYISHKKGETWTPGVNIKTPVNSKGHDATISLTADGRVLYLYRHKKAGGLYVTKFDTLGKKWNEPSAVEKPLNSKYYETTICQSADGNILFFTSDRPGGFGGKDIYMVRKSGENQWSEPQNLGAKVNTVFDDDAPFFHPDGKTLYFSSNGPNSIGGYDIFVTEWDSVNNGWLDPLNMGYPVNTADDDIYFVINQTGLTGYYSSGVEGGYGEKDIYRIDFPYYRYPKRYYAVEVVGVVQDVETQDTLNAMVRLVDINTGMVLDSMPTDAKTKQYAFEVEAGSDYIIEAYSPGYDPRVEELSAPPPSDDDITMIKNFRVPKPKTPPVAVVKNELPEIQHIYYDFDKDFLRTEAKAELDRVINLLNQDPTLSVELKAHADWYNTFSYNVDLSRRRVKSAHDYLVHNGIPTSRIRQTWFSENRPIETNENDEGRQYNRRCEFRFLKNDQLVLASTKLRTGQEGPRVDHATPKGQPGFDAPNAVVDPSFADAATASQTASQTLAQAEVMPEYTLPVATPTPVTLASNVQVNGLTNNAKELASSSELEAISVQNIYFDFDRSSLRNDAIAELDKIAEILRSNPGYKLEIAGHTDGLGANSYNDKLASSRCQSAYDYLLKAGVNSDNVTTRSLGETSPIASNDSDMGRQSNRRVEFVIRKSTGEVMISER